MDFIKDLPAGGPAARPLCVGIVQLLLARWQGADVLCTGSLCRVTSGSGAVAAVDRAPLCPIATRAGALGREEEEMSGMGQAWVRAGGAGKGLAGVAQ